MKRHTNFKLLVSKKSIQYGTDLRVDIEDATEEEMGDLIT